MKCTSFKANTVSLKGLTLHDEPKPLGVGGEEGGGKVPKTFSIKTGDLYYKTKTLIRIMAFR